MELTVVKEEILTPIIKMTKDIKNASLVLSDNEARFLVDSYYMMQENRIRADSQIRSMGETEEPHMVLDWLSAQNRMLENQVKSALDVYSMSTEVGRWARSICGVGPVIAAGLLAHIDITKAPTAGAIYRFAGLDPTFIWESSDFISKMFDEVVVENKESFNKEELLKEQLKLVCLNMGRHYSSVMQKMEELEYKVTKTNLLKVLARKPFNGSLKTLCWKLGESFVKVSGNDNDFYGKLYLAKKQKETALNEMGKYADQAKAKLERFNIGKSTDAYKAYSIGKLPKAHIHARAKRYAVKIFLSHFHEVYFRTKFGVAPPKPFELMVEGHSHKIEVPNFNQIMK